MTPLHKLSGDERRQREDAGLPPKLRPINSGTLLAKTVLSAVLESPAATRSTEKLAPFQLAIGVSRGVEKLIHVCRAAHASGWLVGRNDFANGFNSLCRQKMLDANCAQFPESTDVFNFFYGMDSPILLFDDNCNITVLNSSEGPRQGCAAGSHSFALTIHPLLVELQTKYPEFEIRVLTDDIIPLVPPPSNPGGWQELYLRYGCFLRDLRDLAAKHGGLHLNMDKCGLLLPPSAPEPNSEVRAIFPALFDFRSDGFRIAGSPIGTEAFVSKFIEGKLFEGLYKLNAIKQIGNRSPRAAHRLISTCATKLFSFLAATVPPTVMLPVLKTFDDHIQATFLHVLAPIGFECSEDRMERAIMKASLPFPLGCGLFKAADQGAIACQCRTVCRMPCCSSCAGGLVLLWMMLGNMSCTHLGVVTRSSGLKRSRSFLLLHLVCWTDPFIRLRMLPPKFDCARRSFGCARAEESKATRTRTLAGCIFAEPMNDALPFTFTNESYISWCCSFLGLPINTLSNHVHSPDFDYPVQKCQSLHAGSLPFS